MPMVSRCFTLLLTALLLAWSPAALAQDEGASLFGLSIPAGWTDASTGNVAHFTDPETGVDLFMMIVDAVDVATAIDTALQTAIDSDFAAEPTETGELDRANGFWTQHLYNMGDGEVINAVGQRSANDLSYVVLQRGAAAALDDTRPAFELLLASVFITPENRSFLALGLGVAAALLGLFIISMIVRQRNLVQDMALLKHLAEDEAA